MFILDTVVGSRVSWANSKQENPAISGSTVVWEDNRDGDYYSKSVYYKNISTGLGSRVSWTDSYQQTPAISYWYPPIDFLRWI